MNKKLSVIIGVFMILCICCACGKKIDTTTNVNTNYLAIGIDNGKRIDSIMVISINDNENLSVLSIPRDIRDIKEKYKSGINSSNIDNVKNDLSNLLDTKIDKYIVFDFETLLRVFSQIGNVDFEIPDLYDDGVGMIYDDDVQDLHISLVPGQHSLSPEDMLYVIRYIKNNANENGDFLTYENGDVDRINMQHQLINSLIVQKQKIFSESDILDIYKSLFDKLLTNLNSSDIIRLYNIVNEINPNNIVFKILDGQYITEDNEKYFVPTIDNIKIGTE